MTIALMAGTLGLLQPTPLMAQVLLKGSGWGATVVMEPIIIAHGGFAALCNPRAAKIATWGVQQVEKVVKPTDSQRAALSDLKAAADKAANLSSGACPAVIPRISSERLAFLEKRLAALLEVAKTVGPPFDAFYSLLSDEQKARLDAGPRRWRWRRE
jgi:hypothetical protein